MVGADIAVAKEAMTREGKPDYQYQPRCHVNGIFPTTPWLFSYENTLKRVKCSQAISIYFDTGWSYNDNILTQTNKNIEHMHNID